MKVIGYENYEVLEDGTVIGARGNVLKLDLNSTGYARVTLSKDGIAKRVFVHRLIAEHFCVKPEGSECVNHIDGDITNNSSSNLEWTTNSYNIQDGWDRGRVNTLKYSDSRISTIRSLHKDGISIKEIARKIGGDRGTISNYI